MAAFGRKSRKCVDRRHFMGGSDARIIMGDDDASLVQLWREKRGEAVPCRAGGPLWEPHCPAWGGH
jgi:predicted phage-related endonuclease